MSGGEASAPADATPPDFCARRSSLEVFSVFSRRFPLFALSLFLALLLVPSRAYAWDVLPKGVVYSTDLDGSRVGYVVSAYNQFDAACYAMGKDPNTIGSAFKQKLSDSDYGGRFYDYAQSFFTQSGGLENVPTWVPAYVILISELGDLVLADYQGVWYSTATKSLYDGAMDDFVRVLSGEDLGGGSVVPVGSYMSFDMQAFANNTRITNVSGTQATAQNAVYTDGSLVIQSGTKVFSPYTRSSNYVSHGVFYANSDIINLANMYLNQGYYVAFTKGLGASCGLVYGRNLRVIQEQFSNGVWRWAFTADGDICFASFSANAYYNSSDGVFCFVPYFGEDYSFTVRENPFSPSYFTQPITEPFSSAPSGSWPDPTPTPEPTSPDLPEPVEPTVTPDPVVTEPSPSWPDVNITVNPPAVIVPETPEGLDYTALLTLINDNLESIDSYTVAINSSLNSLRSDLVTEFNGVVQSLRNIYSYLQHMDSVLERHCVHLQNKMEDVSADIQNKMRELVHWLAEQLDFDSESSGNSDLFGILSTINDKLGGGTYEPNPIRDEQGYYEWLDNLWDRFLLGDNWQSSASSMSQSFGQLTNRFPFSVPWDIVALFRLFVHEPVTPVFDLPLYYSSEDSATVRVDLSAWDGVASVVRPLVFVIFALNLALLSRHLLAGFGADKGGL